MCVVLYLSIRLSSRSCTRGKAGKRFESGMEGRVIRIKNNLMSVYTSLSEQL